MTGRRCARSICEFGLSARHLGPVAPGTGKPAPDQALAAWLKANNDLLYISAVTIAEIEQGIHKLSRAGGIERAQSLAGWLDTLIEDGGGHILPLDARTGRIVGRLSDRALAMGRHPGFADVAIAATAVAHDLLLLTRNGKHFVPLEIPFSDPLAGLPTWPGRGGRSSP